jgi:hypothetical protein
VGDEADPLAERNLTLRRERLIQRLANLGFHLFLSNVLPEILAGPDKEIGHVEDDPVRELVGDVRVAGVPVLLDLPSPRRDVAGGECVGQEVLAHGLDDLGVIDRIAGGTRPERSRDRPVVRVAIGRTGAGDPHPDRVDSGVDEVGVVLVRERLIARLDGFRHLAGDESSRTMGRPWRSAGLCRWSPGGSRR